MNNWSNQGAAVKPKRYAANTDLTANDEVIAQNDVVKIFTHNAELKVIIDLDALSEPRDDSKPKRSISLNITHLNNQQKAPVSCASIVVNGSKQLGLAVTKKSVGGNLTGILQTADSADIEEKKLNLIKEFISAVITTESGNMHAHTVEDNHASAQEIDKQGVFKKLAESMQAKKHPQAPSKTNEEWAALTPPLNPCHGY